jgi:hypothetical protein
MKQDIERILESKMDGESRYVPKGIPERLYIIGDTDGRFVKIGIAREPESRLSSLQTGCPHKLIILALFNIPNAKVERKLHACLSPYRIQGEWFELTGEVSATIKELYLSYYCGMTLPIFNELYGRDPQGVI